MAKRLVLVAASCVLLALGAVGATPELACGGYPCSEIGEWCHETAEDPLFYGEYRECRVGFCAGAPDCNNDSNQCICAESGESGPR